MDNRFLNPSYIKNYNLIIDTILNKGRTPKVLAIENIGDLISILNYNDKRRNIDDPELKKAIFTIVKGMLDSGIVELWWDYCWVASARNSPPTTQEEIFKFLEHYWNMDDGMGLDRNYLLWFNKIGNVIKNI